MAWKCPECGIINNNDSLIRCVCGHEIDQNDQIEWVRDDIQIKQNKLSQYISLILIVPWIFFIIYSIVTGLWPELLIFVILWMVFGLTVGFLAKRKNRNALLWGVIGAFYLVPAMLILMFMSYLCPNCHGKLNRKQWKDRRCPTCGTV